VAPAPAPAPAQAQQAAPASPATVVVTAEWRSFELVRAPRTPLARPKASRRLRVCGANPAALLRSRLNPRRPSSTAWKSTARRASPCR
jgi:hypothetical protein